MKSYDELTKQLLERRDRYETLRKQKKQKVKRIVTPLCCFLLVGLLTFGVWQSGLYRIFISDQPTNSDSQSASSLPSSQEESQTSVDSKESKPNLSTVTSHQQSSVASKPNGETSVDSKVPASQQQGDTTPSSETTSQAPVPSFQVKRPHPGYLVQSDTFGDAAEGDAAEVTCRFANLKTLHNWLENGGKEERLRENILNFFAEGSPTLTPTSYYRPTLGDGKKGWQLTNINVEYEELYYNYVMSTNEGKTNLGIYIGISNYRIDVLADDMQESSELINGSVGNYYPLFDRYCYVTVKGVEYACYYFPGDGVTSVYWKTNGITFCAVYDGQYRDVGKVLSLLGMEQVSYKVVK